ncbi:ANTAR domain-containing protein [Mycolicibacterium sp. 120270]|uniref:ANTAR domain-containing protein n=1 Tax=Mycolicibacterium sp. 120270 TaxID=3090600 RepID=UPI00299F1A66|nr:ANTAR domain-containing protein [Mycolicibacterium sp. 120270]MDX1885179.1 ANTAR domain-containing protein [Mycolicibacterium sp. 120270]
MDIDRAVGVLVALRRCGLDEASDELLDAAKRHRLPPLAVARALVALADQSDPRTSDDAAIAAARYEWGLLLQSEVVTQ